MLEINSYEEGNKITLIGSTFLGQACKRIPRYQLREMLCEVPKMHVWQTLGQLTAQLRKQKRRPHAWDERAPKGNSRFSGESAVLWRRFTPREETFQVVAGWQMRFPVSSPHTQLLDMFISKLKWVMFHVLNGVSLNCISFKHWTLFYET